MKIYIYCNSLPKGDQESLHKALELSGFTLDEYSIRDLRSFKVSLHPLMVTVGDIAHKKVSPLKSKDEADRSILQIKLPSKMSSEDKKEVIELLKEMRVKLAEYMESNSGTFRREQVFKLLSIPELEKLKERWQESNKRLELAAGDEVYYVYPDEKPGESKNEYTFEEIIGILSAMTLLQADEAKIIED